MNPAAPATFDNCTHGVWATGTDVSVQQARMTDMTNGVTIRLATDRDVVLKHNRISAAATGIYLEHNDPAQQIDVSENIINVAGGKSAGIRVVETNIGHDAAAITDNILNASEGARGMLLRTANDYWIDANTITLVFPDEISRGINIHGSKKCHVSNNAIQGAGNFPQLPQGTGIDVLDSDNTFYDCNTQSNLHTGNAIYQSNAIQINDLYLSKPARGHTDFAEAQLAALESIAEQCPTAGGRAVWQARSLLALTGMEVDYPGECFEPQNQLTIPDMEMPAALDNLKALTVYPNPGHSVTEYCLCHAQPRAARRTGD